MKLSRISTSLRSHLSVLIAATAVCSSAQGAGTKGVLQFNLHDVHGARIACRIHFVDSDGTPQAADGQPFWKDHFLCDGAIELSVDPGRYTWQAERGPEWKRAAGVVIVSPDEATEVEVVLERHTSLNAEGWYSGDMHVHRPVADVPLLMKAEDLNIAPVITWWNLPNKNPVTAAQTLFALEQDRIYSTHAGEDERQGGALIFFGLDRPLDLSVTSREFPSPMHFVAKARRANSDVWIDIEKPFWWDVPTWLATGQMDSIGLAHNHMHRSGVLNNEAWGKPRPPSADQGIHANGLWTQEIYYHVLNSGLRIPPSAGSASGVLPNPVGYNRVYTYLGQQPLTRDAWFDALKAGRCFVTNGPLLRARANGHWPGATLKTTGPTNVQFEVKLSSNDAISKLEVIANGEVLKEVEVPRDSHSHLRFTVPVNEPGWFLLRAIADVDHTFRFASTAPWSIDLDGYETPISRTSSQFFLDWVNERIEIISETVIDPAERDAVLQWHVQARDFWMKRRDQANAN